MKICIQCKQIKKCTDWQFKDQFWCLNCEVDFWTQESPWAVMRNWDSLIEALTKLANPIELLEIEDRLNKIRKKAKKMRVYTRVFVDQVLAQCIKEDARCTYCGERTSICWQWWPFKETINRTCVKCFPTACDCDTCKENKKNFLKKATHYYSKLNPIELLEFE